MTPLQAYEKVQEIRGILSVGIITYAEAKEMSQEFILIMQDEAARIAKKYKRKAPKFSFSSLMR